MLVEDAVVRVLLLELVLQLPAKIHLDEHEAEVEDACGVVRSVVFLYRGVSRSTHSVFIDFEIQGARYAIGHVRMR